MGYLSTSSLCHDRRYYRCQAIGLKRLVRRHASVVMRVQRPRFERASIKGISSSSFDRASKNDINLSLEPNAATSRSNSSACSRRKSSLEGERMRSVSDLVSASSSLSERSSLLRSTVLISQGKRDQVRS